MHTNVVRSALLYKSGYKRRHVWALYSRMKRLWIIQRLWELAKYNFRMFTGAGRRHELPAPLRWHQLSRYIPSQLAKGIQVWLSLLACCILNYVLCAHACNCEGVRVSR